MAGLLLVGYWTLQRRRALFSIPTANVDIEGGWIDFPPSAMKAGVGIRCRIGADAVAAIRRLAPLTGERLFTWGRKGSYLGREFSGILRRAGVPPSKRKNGQFHKLRRTAATHLAARGHLQTVCDLLGHSQVYVGKRYICKELLPGHDATALLPQLMDDATNPRGPENGNSH